MKKSLLIILTTALLAACGGGKKAIIDGTVTGIADGTSIYLFTPKADTVGSTVVSGGKFSLKIAKAYPDQYVLSVGEDKYYRFFVEPGTIVATIGENTEPVFSGTPTNDGFEKYKEANLSLEEKSKETLLQIRTLHRPGTPGYDSLLAIYNEISDQMDQLVDKTIAENADTPLAAYFLNRTAYNRTTPEAVDEALAIVAAAPDNAFTDALRERRDRLAASAVGQKAPDFTQAQPDGTPLSLSELEGQLVLIDFWASWCGPCRGENPNVVKLYDRFHDKGFEILGVSLDSDREDWLQAIEDDGLRWKHVSDLDAWGNAVAEQYAVRSIPHTVLVGPDGVILARNLRGAALEAKVAEILEQ
jgi:peroxiredoxin